MTAKADCHTGLQLTPMDESTPAGGHVKRPMNPFMVWAKTRRKAIAKENPKMHNSEISRKLGDEWKNMPPDEKQRYIDEANRLKDEHRKANPDYKYKPKSKKRVVSSAGASAPAAASSSPDQKLSVKQQKLKQKQKQLQQQLSIDESEQQLGAQQHYQAGPISDAPIAVAPAGNHLHLLSAGHPHDQQFSSYQMVLSSEQQNQQSFYAPYMINIDSQSSLLMQQQQQQQQQQQYHHSAFSHLDSSAALDVPLSSVLHPHLHQQHQHSMFSGLTAPYASPDHSLHMFQQQHQFCHHHLQQQQSGLCEQIPVPSNQSSSVYSIDYDVAGSGGVGVGSSASDYVVADANRQTVPVTQL